ncbi:MAG: glutamyl-tRNA reductase [Phycisphaerae bacterium]
MRILRVGATYETAEVALRERLSIEGDCLSVALADLSDHWPDAELLILSTCNRTELYTARPVHGHPREDELRRWFREFTGVEAELCERTLRTFADADAVGYLFEVACGLRSMVVGEAEIVAQLKDAYAAARRAGTAGAVINELVQTALEASKEVRRSTGIARGKVSVASVAVDFVAETAGSLAGKCVLNVGAGKTNELMLRRLSELGAGELLITNRSRKRAEDLARRCGGRVVGWETLADHLGRADVVVTSTASQRPVITREMLSAAAGGGRGLLVVDLAVPRDVEPAAGELEGVTLYNIDHLSGAVEAAMQSRRAHTESAERIVRRYVNEFLEKLNIRRVAPTIRSLYRLAHQIADDEMRRADNKLSEHDDAAEDAAIVRHAVHRTLRRMLHPAVENLRKTAGTDSARADVAAIRKLFGLDDEEGGH